MPASRSERQPSLAGLRAKTLRWMTGPDWVEACILHRHALYLVLWGTGVQGFTFPPLWCSSMHMGGCEGCYLRLVVWWMRVALGVARWQPSLLEEGNWFLNQTSNTWRGVASVIRWMVRRGVLRWATGSLQGSIFVGSSLVVWIHCNTPLTCSDLTIISVLCWRKQ